MNCNNCPASRVLGVCPQKPKRENYKDENKYLIDLESGVWDCKKTVEILCKEIIDKDNDLWEAVKLIMWLKDELKNKDDWKGAIALASRVNRFIQKYDKKGE